MCTLYHTFHGVKSLKKKIGSINVIFHALDSKFRDDKFKKEI